MEVLLYKSFTEQENFINFEVTNINFYKNESSPFIDQFQTHYVDLKGGLNKLDSCAKEINGISHEIELIHFRLNKYNQLFFKMVKTMLKRGYKDMGTEGKMRAAAHQLEDSSSIDKTILLMLRRHEKDFILRQETQYIEKFELQIKKIKGLLNMQTKSDSINLELINTYNHYFHELAVYERIIGIKTNEGFKALLNKEANLIFNQFDLLSIRIQVHEEKMLQKLNRSIIIFWIIIALLLTYLIFSLSNRLTRRITYLSRQIQEVVDHNFSTRIKVLHQPKKDEVGQLWSNIIRMEEELHDYINHFIEKVHDKTSELREKNDQIKAQNEQISKQKEKAQEQNKELIDGMKYGWRIQRALIPNEEKLNKTIGDGFVYFSPKDIVSGDIYWIRNFYSPKGEDILFSVIDCTGHGVPGAFMSILAVNAINDAVFRKNNIEPHLILKETNNYVYNSMKYYIHDFQKSSVKDGMDLAFCKLNRKKLRLSFVGASRPLYIIRHKKEGKDMDFGLNNDEYRITEQDDKVLCEIMPLKATIGTMNQLEAEQLVSKEIKLNNGDYLYIFSDGYPDQFGGPKNKKFMTKRFKQLLLKISTLSSKQQREILKNTLKDWQGSQEQIDDICVMGVKV